MPDLLYPYLVGVVSTVIVLLAAVWAFIVSYRRAIDYARKEDRLPLATRWEDLSHRVADLELQHDHLRDELQQAKLTIEEAQRERDWLERNRTEVEQMKIERQQLEQVRGELQQTLEQLASGRQRLDELQKELAKADFTRQQLHERAQSLEKQIKEQSAALKREESRLDELRRESADADKRLIEARKQLGDFGEAVAQAQRRAEALQREIQELTQARSDLKKQRDTLETRANELRAETAKLQERAAECEERAELLNNRLDELRREERKRDKAIMSPKEALAELFQPVIKLDEYRSPLQVLSESEALDRVRQYLGVHGLRFSKRALNGFHTSLKVASDTPLLVLAGISGTGKSLLPRRYAEAMGMHFLGIPVQPRWDGPQDLLGFFNYLENRYKATDLVRALIQFDPIERNWVPDEYDGFADDRILMVLLDEMNLARIEYYFSEFLSRLETRRDTDPSQHADRAKAEIGLDIGRFGEEANCRVFVDTNVLFVGTMNEDESTLTLSDKVIDRANVMRFGRPVSLSLAERDGDVRATRLRAAGYLTKEMWRDWIAERAQRALPDEVERWISDLNESLVRIGRPFGYRTRNAMRAYVRQYPDDSEEGIRLAVADQVEQRILPKLRGIDPAEDAGQRAIEGVRRVVQDLQDRELLDAMERGASGQGGHLFTWLGVERADDEE